MVLLSAVEMNRLGVAYTAELLSKSVLLLYLYTERRVARMPNLSAISTSFVCEKCPGKKTVCPRSTNDGRVIFIFRVDLRI